MSKQKEAIEIGIKIDGEFLTNLFRNLFWEDGRPYTEVKGSIMDSLGLPESQGVRIVQDLLEGRKKLVGIN